jgi:hypothetical protein
MDCGTPEIAQTVDALPLGRKRRSPLSRKVEFDEDGDGRLLSLVRNATFISDAQLVKLALCLGIKPYRQAVRQRVNRYIEFKLIRVLPPVAPYKGAVYQITRSGLSVLETYGMGLCSISSDTETLPSELQAPHFLELNEVRLAFSNDPILGRAEWLSDPEIKSRNTAPHVIPFAKDYDSIVKLKDHQGKEFLVGLEYERTYKDARRYDEVVQRIEREKQICCVIYIVGSIDLIGRLIEVLRCPTFPLCVTAAGVLKQQCLDVNVGFMTANGRRFSTLRQYLTSLKHAM